MVQVHLYGSLRRCVPDSRPDRECVVQLQPQSEETVRTLLGRLDISPDEVAHVFLNRALLTSRSPMALWLGYQETREGTVARRLELDVPVRSGDRVALFAQDMALLVV